MSKGGVRRGAGRKPGGGRFKGSPTFNVRVPITIRDYMDEFWELVLDLHERITQGSRESAGHKPNERR